MGRIYKHANIYKKGKIVRHVNSNGKLEPMCIEEVEELVDELGNDKDENGNIKDPQAFNNASQHLFKMYQTEGNPHEADLIHRLNEAKSTKTTEEQVEEKLEEVKKELEMDRYVDFEEVKNMEDDGNGNILG